MSSLEMNVSYTGGTRLAVLAAVSVVAGCSLIYDSDEFLYVDAAPPTPDAMVDARYIPDVDVDALVLTGISPDTVVEGAGCLPDGDGGCAAGSRAIPIVLEGSNIAADAVVTLDGIGYTGEQVDATVDVDRSKIAFTIAVPVMPGLDEGMTDPLMITVSQGTVTDDQVLMIVGLDEFVASVDAAGGTLAVTALDPRYSRIDIDDEIVFTGGAPARLIATAEIVLDGALLADGGDATASEGGAAGPGGCAGGGRAAPGQCPEAGGAAGGTSGGGGGGGGGDIGSTGGGDGGAGGAEVGDPTLTPLGGTGASAPRGHGGGGGGDGDGLTPGDGGPGGGGGGVVELTSGGRLHVASNGVVSADGGDGDPGTGACDLVLTESGGGGGGGGGGAILVRAGLELVDDAAAAAVSVEPGGGGDRETDGCNDGGAGAPGRVRFDVPDSAATPGFVSGTTHLYRGPVLDPATPSLVTENAVLAVTVFGSLGTTYWIEVIGGAKEPVTLDAGTTASVEVTLAPGLNTVCALVADTVNASQPEGRHCLDIAYMPQQP